MFRVAQNLEKYRELYSLSKEVYNSELDRFHRVEDKASRYLTCLTFVIGIFGLFGKWIITEALPPSSLVEWLVIATSLG